MRRPHLAGMAASVALTLVLITATLTSAATLGDVRVTNDQGGAGYLSTEQLGGTGSYTDNTLKSCGDDRRQQNEPTIATNPRNPTIMTSGSNDYCTTPTTGDAWAGYYYSTNAGQTWIDSLLPGYPTDTSPEGQASPLHQGGITAAGDPVQSWDLEGHLFYMGNAFNRTRPQNGSVWVATYAPGAQGDGSRYVRTVIVGRGTPAVNGRFNDKTAIQVDQSPTSPYKNNVYVAWSLFQGVAGNNSIVFSRSTDHGVTFSQQVKLSEGVKDSQFADIAVRSDGTIYVAWRQFATNRGHQQDAVVYVVSHDGGETFTKPVTALFFTPYDAQDQYRSPAAAATAEVEAFVGEAEEEGGYARSCGDGPFACASGYTFFRQDSQVRVTADPTGRLPGVYVAYNATKPGTQTPTGTTYGTVESGLGSQSAVYVKNLLANDGPVLIDSQRSGHQFFADIDANDGALHAVWYDSRVDRAYSPARPVGNNPDGTSPGPSLATFYATSTNGTTWTPGIAVSRQPHNPNYEMFGGRRVPFHGDYLYISAVRGTVGMVWTDNRDVVPGTDPREGAGDRDGSGNDVKQCRTLTVGGTYTSDQCPDAGGVDQNIYAATITR